MAKKTSDFVDDLIKAYTEILNQLADLGAEWIQIDEPALVYDQSAEDLALFKQLYQPILAAKGDLKVLAQTYFGDVRDSYTTLLALDFDGLGLDFNEGRDANLQSLSEYGFPADKTLFAGVINGKNIWRTNYKQALALLQQLPKEAVLSTSTSLLHVPYTTQNETKIAPKELQYLAFAQEKLQELADLDAIREAGVDAPAYQKNQALFATPRYEENAALNAKIAALKPEDYTRLPKRAERLAQQAKVLNLPPLPLTTIAHSHKPLPSAKTAPNCAKAKSPNNNTPSSITPKCAAG